MSSEMTDNRIPQGACDKVLPPIGDSKDLEQDIANLSLIVG